MIDDVLMHLRRPQADLAVPPFHCWKTDDGGNWLEFHRAGNNILLRFPGYADFTVSRDGARVSCVPVPDIDDATVEHLFLNQVLPLARSAGGNLSFHASAVALGNGAAAFVGETGRGKSTIAAGFAAHGHGFLTDDGLSIIERDEGFYVQPSHASLRLWEDSKAAILPDTSTPGATVRYSSKLRFTAADELLHCAQPSRLSALFFLGNGSATTVEIARMKPNETVVELLKNGFHLDIEDSAALGRQFQAAASLCENVPGFRLDYPRRYDLLEAVRGAVADEIRKLEMAK